MMRTTLATFAVFGRYDLRTIRRDTMLVGVGLGPFLYAAFLWLLPLITEFTAERWAFDLVPYHSLLISAFCVLGPPVLLGAVAALQLLDDRDQHTLSALRVTPIPRSVYPAYRATLIAVITPVMVLASLAVSRAVPAEVIWRSVPVAILAGVTAPAIGLPLALLGRNKLEGLAVMRVVGLAAFTLPLIPFFLEDSPWQLAFGILPPYWPVRAFWSAMDGGTLWPYVLAGLLYNGVFTAVIVRLVGHRLR